MTSANVVEYTIFKGDKQIGRFSKHTLTKFPDYAELLKYQPLNSHTILPWGYDEEEEQWEGQPENLEKYLKKMATSNKWLKAYFAGEKTAEQILQEIKSAQDEIHQKFVVGLKKVNQ